MLDFSRDPRAAGPAPPDAFEAGDAPSLDDLAALARSRFRKPSLFILYGLASAQAQSPDE